MLTDKDLQDITRAAAGGHLASAATVLELVDEITRRRQAFAETETVPLEALVPSLAEFVAGMRAEIALKIAPLRPASGTHFAAEEWTRAIDEAARGAAHHLLNTCEVARPPCQHDELMYVCELSRRERELIRLRAALAYCKGHLIDGDASFGPTVVEAADGIAAGKCHRDGSIHYPGIGGCDRGPADDCKENP